MKPSSAAATRPKPQAEPFRSMIGRTPHIQMHGDIVTSPAAPNAAGTVVAAGKFKATCLQLLDAAEKGESITITKRGKVVARLVPPERTEARPFVPLLGLMKGKVKILGDIVSPDFEAWNMEDPRKVRNAHKDKKK